MIPEAPYSEVRLQIRDADLLLWLPTSLHGRAICGASDGMHSHASLTCWQTLSSGTRHLMAVDTQEGRGGGVAALSAMVAAYPSKIDVYRANAGNRWPEYEPLRAKLADVFWDEMVVAPPKYGLWTAAHMGLTKLALLRFLIRPNHDDSHISARPPVCSSAIAQVTRRVTGLDTVPGLADNATWPAHMERSLFYKAKWRLIL